VSRQSALTDIARDLLERPDPMTAGIWPRAAAMLTRQALEAALDELWRRRAPAIAGCSARAQFLCLPSFMPNAEELAKRLAYTWTALSRTCHQHAYDLPPTASELQTWMADVDQLIAHVELRQ
jgi:hypothetical protein